MSLALLSFPNFVADFLEFRRERAGTFNSFTKTFIDFVAALLRPKSGWIWQHAELAVGLEEHLQQHIRARGGWAAHCEQSRKFLIDTLNALVKSGSIKLSRDPFLPILPLLKLEQPLEPIIRGLKLSKRDLKLMEHASKSIGPSIAASWRDHLLISFLCRFPLRAQHWCSMTYRPHDNTGHLRRNARGWELVLPYEDFKNYANTRIFKRRGDQLLILDFSAPQNALLNQLSDLLDEYTTKYWPVLAQGNDVLFPNEKAKRVSTDNLYVFVRRWTAEYVADTSPRGYGISGVIPFGTHSFRDLVATSLAKNVSPEAAAAALLDSVKMIHEHYARFIPADLLKSAFVGLGPAFSDYDDPL